MNKNNYKNLFNKIDISAEKIEEIKTMPLETKSARRSFKANFATALMILSGVFVVSNGITYAATGDSLVKKVSDSISNYVDDKTMEQYKTEEYVDDDGNAHYKYEVGDTIIENVVDESALEDESLKINSSYTEEKDGGENVYSIEIAPAEASNETTSNEE